MSAVGEEGERVYLRCCGLEAGRWELGGVFALEDGQISRDDRLRLG